MPEHKPLTGIRILEIGGIGPAPFAAMLFADLGATVLRIDRPGTQRDPSDVIARGRQRIIVDLKTADGAQLVRDLAKKADVLIEGFRPGVMERLGLGPDDLLAQNPALVFGRMTGWGQTGPRAQQVGHDINYIALAGALHMIGPAENPVIPTNLVGDFGGGALYLAFGILAAVLSARQTGQGQVIDCAMVDGVASLMSMAYGNLATGYWVDRRQSNSVDGGSHFYNVYECADGKWLAVGAVEPQFYQNLLDGLGIEDHTAFPQRQRDQWPALTEAFRKIFRTKPQSEWRARLEDRDTCVTPVLSMSEAPTDPHAKARSLFSAQDGVTHTAPAPRFSASPNLSPGSVQAPKEWHEANLSDWGMTPKA